MNDSGTYNSPEHTHLLANQERVTVCNHDNQSNEDKPCINKC